jgi:GMP synthase-like glutamine amidotransferase
MNVQVLQHASFEGIGNMDKWLAARGANVQHSYLFSESRLPRPKGLHLVIAMGGPMSVNDEAQFPWLSAEKSFLREAIDLGVPILGVCLGAQLIANVLGAAVYRNATKEIGWFPLDAVDGTQEAFRFPGKFAAFHWHGETFDLPAGAVHLARTQACVNQAFQVGRRIIGLQFHLEVTDAGVREMVAHGEREIARSGAFVQTREVICTPPPGTYAAVSSLMHQILDHLVSDEMRPGTGRITN